VRPVEIGCNEARVAETRTGSAARIGPGNVLLRL